MKLITKIVAKLRAISFYPCTHGKLVDSSEGELQYMNGIHYVNLWHGVPIKQIGDDETGFKYKHITIGKKIKTAIRKVIVPWEFLFDTMLCGSPFFEPFIRSAFGRTYQRFINKFRHIDQLAHVYGWYAYNGFSKKDYYPIKRMSFEGFQACVPNNPDAVLTALFGDYMQLPPEDKRRVHSSKIEFYSER